MEVTCFGRQFRTKDLTNTEFKIIQIGCGGTGSYLVSPLSRFIGSVKKTGRKISYTLIDNDVVEEKNVIRQNYCISDIGTPKVTAMYNRYGENQEIDEIFVEKCTKDFLLNMYRDSILESNGTSTIFVGCVDNIETRMVIYDFLKFFSERRDADFQNVGDLFYIDAGNHTTGGQILVCQEIEQQGESITIEPEFKKIFESVSKIEKKIPGCTEMGDQSILANHLSSTYLYGVINEIISYGFSTMRAIYFTRYNTTIDGDDFAANLLGTM